MSIILSLLSAHLISIIEGLIISSEPEIAAVVDKEIELLIAKLETYLQNKSPKASKIVNPVLNVVESVSQSAINAGGDTVVSTLQQESGAA